MSIPIPPGPFPSRPKRTFEIRLGDSVGVTLGSIQADTYLQAAGYASRQLFGGSGNVMRATGWGDAPGTFLDTAVGRPPVLFFHRRARSDGATPAWSLPKRG